MLAGTNVVADGGDSAERHEIHKNQSIPDRRVE